MYKNRRGIQRIIKKYLAGKTTQSEQDFLDAYDNLFAQENSHQTDSLNAEEKAQLEKKLERNVSAIIERHDHKVVRLWPRIAVAAAICLAFVTGGYIFLQNYYLKTTNLATAKVIRIQPGSNKAILTLANGTQIYLSQQKNGQIAAQNGVSIMKTVNGRIAYQQDSLKQPVTAVAANNTVSTPNGGQYQVVLPDDTKVWLDAASSLSFPVSFAGASARVVSLKGEAYFEVAKDKKHPFTVQTAHQMVTVLGTHFNINAYSDEPATVTTLLEGRVMVNSNYSIVPAVLSPDQQSTCTAGRLTVKNVIAEDAIAWKEGYFRFDNEPLEEALRKIGRWYNVAIVYKDEEIKNKTTYGTMSRFSNIGDVVQLLELAKAAKFEITDNKIIVSRYN